VGVDLCEKLPGDVELHHEKLVVSADRFADRGLVSLELPQRSRTTTLLIPEQSDRRWALDRRDHPGGSRLCSRQRGVFQARSESTTLASLLLEAGRTTKSNA
jgi:hypothetical protein